MSSRPLSPTQRTHTTAHTEAHASGSAPFLVSSREAERNKARHHGIGPSLLCGYGAEFAQEDGAVQSTSPSLRLKEKKKIVSAWKEKIETEGFPEPVPQFTVGKRRTDAAAVPARGALPGFDFGTPIDDDPDTTFRKGFSRGDSQATSLPVRVRPGAARSFSSPLEARLDGFPLRSPSGSGRAPARSPSGDLNTGPSSASSVAPQHHTQQQQPQQRQGASTSPSGHAVFQGSSTRHQKQGHVDSSFGEVAPPAALRPVDHALEEAAAAAAVASAALGYTAADADAHRKPFPAPSPLGTGPAAPRDDPRLARSNTQLEGHAVSRERVSASPRSSAFRPRLPPDEDPSQPGWNLLPCKEEAPLLAHRKGGVVHRGAAHVDTKRVMQWSLQEEPTPPRRQYKAVSEGGPQDWLMLSHAGSTTRWDEKVLPCDDVPLMMSQHESFPWPAEAPQAADGGRLEGRLEETVLGADGSPAASHVPPPELGEYGFFRSPDPYSPDVRPMGVPDQDPAGHTDGALGSITPAHDGDRTPPGPRAGSTPTAPVGYGNPELAQARRGPSESAAAYADSPYDGHHRSATPRALSLQRKHDHEFDAPGMVVAKAQPPLKRGKKYIQPPMTIKYHDELVEEYEQGLRSGMYSPDDERDMANVDARRQQSRSRSASQGNSRTHSRTHSQGASHGRNTPKNAAGGSGSTPRRQPAVGDLFAQQVQQADVPQDVSAAGTIDNGGYRGYSDAPHLTAFATPTGSVFPSGTTTPGVGGHGADVGASPAGLSSRQSAAAHDNHGQPLAYERNQPVQEQQGEAQQYQDALYGVDLLGTGAQQYAASEGGQSARGAANAYPSGGLGAGGYPTRVGQPPPAVAVPLLPAGTQPERVHPTVASPEDEAAMGDRYYRNHGAGVPVRVDLPAREPSASAASSEGAGLRAWRERERQQHGVHQDSVESVELRRPPMPAAPGVRSVPRYEVPAQRLAAVDYHRAGKLQQSTVAVPDGVAGTFDVTNAYVGTAAVSAEDLAMPDDPLMIQLQGRGEQHSVSRSESQAESQQRGASRPGTHRSELHALSDPTSPSVSNALQTLGLQGIRLPSERFVTSPTWPSGGSHHQGQRGRHQHSGPVDVPLMQRTESPASASWGQEVDRRELPYAASPPRELF